MLAVSRPMSEELSSRSQRAVGRRKDTQRISTASLALAQPQTTNSSQWNNPNPESKSRTRNLKMATSSERSPPPFPDSEDQDVLDTEEVGGRDSHSDEDDGDDLFMSTSNPPLTGMDSILSPTIEPSNVLMKPPVDLMADPLFEPVSIQTANTPSSKVEPSDDFVDLTNNITDSLDEEDAAESPVADAEEDKTEIPLDEPAEEFEDIFGSETEAPQEE
ncbi:hypothetical protein F7725_023207 [Dissostichus mawsoni]|uniref:Uncharacterized protein n=1 Tax=Dissostichus mawsoni TaxID=36200 RepID=A0A7J5Z007_DISMA|nr:hypothetical protein F7725_023207 [Dissostichus mawsoni]